VSDPLPPWSIEQPLLVGTNVLLRGAAVLVSSVRGPARLCLKRLRGTLRGGDGGLAPRGMHLVEISLVAQHQQNLACASNATFGAVLRG